MSPSKSSADSVDGEIGHHRASSHRYPVRLTPVVLFFEILLVLASVLITWFGLYAVYRLVKDES